MLNILPGFSINPPHPRTEVLLLPLVSKWNSQAWKSHMANNVRVWILSQTAIQTFNLHLVYLVMVGYSLWGLEESDMTQWARTHTIRCYTWETRKNHLDAAIRSADVNCLTDAKTGQSPPDSLQSCGQEPQALPSRFYNLRLKGKERPRDPGNLITREILHSHCGC